MIQKIAPGPLCGVVAAIPSKSMAHRLLICNALSGGHGTVVCHGTSRDIEATEACLKALHTGDRLPCGESGSTLRFLLPVAAALEKPVEFLMQGRLPQRPLSPLDTQLEAHGVHLSRPAPDILRCEGRLTPGAYTLPGDVSSQYISGLLFALPLLESPSTLTVTGRMESAPYVAMTLDALRQFGVAIAVQGQTFQIPGGGYGAGKTVQVEGDWSNAAFWLCAGALGAPVTVTGLRENSLQGDRAVCEILSRFGAVVNGTTVSPAPLRAMEIDASAIPDLVPVLAVVAAAATGTTCFTNAQRLRLKESDRIASVLQMLKNLGADARETADGLVVHGGRCLRGGTVDSCNDHRIAMAAAIASILCEDTVCITGAEAVEKSYPGFWADFAALKQSGLGGIV